MEVKPLRALKLVRLERGLKRYEVAAKIGVSDMTLKRWEKGESEPGLTEALALARHYEVGVEELDGPHATQAAS